MYYKFPTALVNLPRAGKEFCGGGGQVLLTDWMVSMAGLTTWSRLCLPATPSLYVAHQRVHTAVLSSVQYSTAMSQPRYASITSHPIKQRVHYLHADMEWQQQLHIDSDSDTLYVVTVSDNIWHLSTAAL